MPFIGLGLLIFLFSVSFIEDYTKNLWIDNSYKINCTIINKTIDTISYLSVNRRCCKWDTYYILYLKLLYINKIYDILVFSSENIYLTSEQNLKYTINSSVYVNYNPVLEEIKL